MFKSSFLMTIAITLLVTQSNLAAQSEDEPGNSTIRMTLNDNYVASLKSIGSLQSPVQEDAQGKIVAVVLQFSDTATEAAVPTSAPTVVAGNVCQIRLDDAMIELVKSQPVRIEVPENSMFSRVLLNYENPNDLESSPTPQSTFDSDNVYYQHFVKLSDDEMIQGQMDLAQTIKFNTKFGDVDISLGQISGIRFHIDGEDAAMVVLKNGDSITGVPTSDSFVLNTDWGQAEFDPVYVESITTSQNAQFSQTNDPGFGPRWQLIGGR